MSCKFCKGLPGRHTNLGVLTASNRCNTSACLNVGFVGGRGLILILLALRRLAFRQQLVQFVERSKNFALLQFFSSVQGLLRHDLQLLLGGGVDAFLVSLRHIERKLPEEHERQVPFIRH